jgi:hypothetical protein
MASILDVVGNVVQQGVAGLLGAAGGLARDLRTAFTGTAPLTEEMRIKMIDQANALEKAASDLQTQMVTGQIDLNKLDAQSGSLFRAGWRPFVGWVCAAGLAYEYLLQPFLAWGSAIWVIPVPPHLDMSTLMPLLLGLLGIAGMRTMEKIKGVG